MDFIRKRNSIAIIDNEKSPTRTISQKRFSMIEQTLYNDQFPLEFQRKISLHDSKPSSTFLSKDEFIEAMVEDLCDWLNFLYKLDNDNQMIPSQFFQQLEDGIILNKHAGVVQYLAENYLITENIFNRMLPMKIGNQKLRVPKTSPRYVSVDFTKKTNAFQKRDNVANFIQWCRDFNIPNCLTFETEDLITNKNPRNVVVCLLEVARIGRLFEMEVPDIIQMEEEIDKEIVNETVNSPTTSESPKLDVCRFPNQSIDIDNVDGDKYRNVTFRKKGLENEGHGDYNYPDDEDNDIDSKLSKVTLRKKTIQRMLPDRRFSHESALVDNKSKSQSVTHCSYDLSSKDLDPSYLNGDGYGIGRFHSHGMRVDNSDNESINSHGSQYLIPKYKVFKPVGRVKIYDCFDKTNFVRDKKYREKCDMKSLDEMVREILSECQCSEMFPMKRISEGRYQWGDKKSHIFVRILRNYVMVRVGGGWDTLNNFLRKHDHCRKDKNGCQKPIISPPIKGLLKLSVTCPVDLKTINQEQTMTKGNSTNTISNQNKGCDHIINDIKPIIKSKILTESQLSNKLLTSSKSFEKGESTKFSETKDQSPIIKSKIFHEVNILTKLKSHDNKDITKIPNVKDHSPEMNIKQKNYSVENNVMPKVPNEVMLKNVASRNIQPDQKSDKYRSKIPVLKR